ncbi:MAG: hypothetical protein M3Q81_03490 [bacterium]|nr:hypothetical protein [bacterium]
MLTFITNVAGVVLRSFLLIGALISGAVATGALALWQAGADDSVLYTAIALGLGTIGTFIFASLAWRGTEIDYAESYLRGALLSAAFVIGRSVLSLLEEWRINPTEEGMAVLFVSSGLLFLALFRGLMPQGYKAWRTFSATEAVLSDEPQPFGE